MARRLIFLLSAFLPTNQQLPSARLHRPSTSTSFGGYSQSPPSYAVPILREESLRRRINKRANVAKGSHSRTMSFPAQTGHGPEIHHHDRRISDAASLKTANLPIPGSDIEHERAALLYFDRNSYYHNASLLDTPSGQSTGPAPRPGSSGSLATDD